MDWDEFERRAVSAAKWGADYRRNVGLGSVRAPLKPGETLRRLPESPPETAEPFDRILDDFDAIIMPGMTHWQHPRFFAYFPANAAPESVIAEHLVDAIGAQCMLWQTSPAATELETRMMDWLRQSAGLPETFAGVIQDSASSATFAAVLVMRERALGHAGNRTGLSGSPRLRVYASGETHSSIDRAIWFSGIGSENLVRIPIAGPQRGMDPAALEDAIRADLAAGHRPAGIIACVGATGVGATDDIGAVAGIAARHGLYLHVDAAWAGSAMICPEFRTLWAGVENADSIVFNPHKWLGAQFDCSAHFVRDPELLTRTLAIQPDYLKTHGADGIINYSEWSIPLGRRFRALKLWFLIRARGLDGLRSMIRDHVAWSQALARRIAAQPGFELASQPMLSLFAFRHMPAGIADADAHNLHLLNAINDDGRIYLTQTRLDGKLVIRFQAGSFATTEADVAMAGDVIAEIAGRLTGGAAARLRP